MSAAPKFFTMRTGAEYLGVSRTHLYRLASKPGTSLVVKKIGRKTLIETASLLAFADALPSAELRTFHPSAKRVASSNPST